VEYVARVGTADGDVLVQRLRASSADAVRRELETKGYHVFSVEAARGRIRLPLLRWRERVGSLEFLIFNQQFATLLRAGIPVLQSLDLLHRSQSNQYFREVLARVVDDVRSGIALSESFASQGELFPRLYTATILAGERAGELVPVLERYVRYQEMLEAAKRKVSSALTYPAVLVSLALGLIALLVTYVIPRFAQFYLGFGSDLPFVTQAVISGSTWIQDKSPIIAGVLVIGFILYRRWSRSDRGRYSVDRFKLRLPLVGKIVHYFGLSQFTRSLATLLAGGTPLVNALEVSTSTVTNRALNVPLARVAPRVREGQPLWSSLEATRLFPALSLAMVQVGEATGALEQMLANVSRFYDESVEVRLNRVVTLIEPAVLVLMGLVITVLLLSVYLPMFSLMQRT
jgi:type IV pilus assembly protein PilC